MENQETLLKPIRFSAEICSTQYYDKVVEYDTLEYPIESVRPTETQEDSDYELCEDEDEKDEIHDSNDDDNYYRVFADFETILKVQDMSLTAVLLLMKSEIRKHLKVNTVL